MSLLTLGNKMPPLTQGIALVLIGANEDVREALEVALSESEGHTVTTLEGGETRGIYGFGEALALESDILIVDGYPKTQLMRNKLQEIITSNYVVVQIPGGHARTVKAPKYVIIFASLNEFSPNDKYYRTYAPGNWGGL